MGELSLMLTHYLHNNLNNYRKKERKIKNERNRERNKNESMYFIVKV
jgi:hypothetical protein